MPVGNRLLFSHDRQGKTRKILALSFCAGSIPPLLWLHDTVEDIGTTPAEVEALFGAEVTDDKSLPDRSQTGSAGLMISGSEKSILYTAYCS